MKAPVLLIVSAVASLAAAAPSLAHRAERATTTSPVVTPDRAKTTADKPDKTETAPRICLFSVNGKAQRTQRTEPAPNATKQATSPADPPAAPAKQGERICNVATPPAPTPLG